MIRGCKISETPARAEADAASGAVSPLDRAAPMFVAGHRGLVGSAIWRALRARGFDRLLGRTSSSLDLRDRHAVFEFFAKERPVNVIVAAAKVGGILANDTFPVDFISDNLRIQLNVFDAAAKYDVERLLFLGSSCIYPKFASQPIHEKALLTGPLESTNDAYAIAKIAGIIHVRSVRKQHGRPWISAMPTNLYGPGDNFSANTSHVLPALIRRFDEAVASGNHRVANWGTGTPKRELLHVDDMAMACLHLLDRYNSPSHVNVGTGIDHSVAEISEMVAHAVGYCGEVEWDTSKPDGTPRKLLNVELLMSTGWRPSIDLAAGIRSTVDWYQANRRDIRR
jgi:GDP-L-fucose synthase